MRNSCRFTYQLLAIVIILIPIGWVPATAHAQTAQEHFKQGLKYFNAKQLEKARLAFEAAIEGGLDNVRVYYNLGVTQYKLGHYQQAYDAFQRANMLPELRFLSHVNSALCAEKLNLQSLAIDHLRTAEKLAVGTSQRRLVQLKLAQLGVSTDLGVTWSNQVAWGYSDNVSFSNDAVTNASDAGDQFVALTGKLYWHINPNMQSYMDYQIYNYSDLSEYDFQSYRPALSFNTKYSGLAYTFELASKREFLNDSALMDWYSGSVRVDMAVGRKNTLSACYVYIALEPLKQSYELLKSRRKQFQLGINSKRLSGQWGLQYYREKASPEYAGYYSANARNHWTFVYGYAIDPNKQLRLNYRNRKSEYDNRLDRRENISVQVTQRISRHLSLSLSYAYLNNRSTDSRYSYRTRVVSIGMVF